MTVEEGGRLNELLTFMVYLYTKASHSCKPPFES